MAPGHKLGKTLSVDMTGRVAPEIEFALAQFSVQTAESVRRFSDEMALRAAWTIPRLHILALGALGVERGGNQTR